MKTVSFEGTIHVGNELLHSPVSGLPCVHWRLRITQHIAPGHMGPLFKNIAIIGASLYFYANGPGRFAINRADDIGF